MAWARGGDTAPMHPALAKVLSHPEADDRLRAEAFGWLMLCAMASTAHGIEYFITRGVAIQQAGSIARADVLIEVALFSGLIAEVDMDGETAYKMLEDERFIHLIPQEERDYQKQRQRDRNNGALAVPARIRDGDGCRYCGRVVTWGGGNSNMAGVYEHVAEVDPGQETALEDYVVACRGCNVTLKNLKLTPAQKRQRLLPAPEVPYYKQDTIDWIAKHPWTIANRLEVPKASRRRIKVGDPVHPPRSSGATASKAGGPSGPAGIQPAADPAPAATSEAGPLGTADALAPVDPAASESRPGPSGRPGTQPGVDPAGQPSSGPRGHSGSLPGQFPAEPVNSGPSGPPSSQLGANPAEIAPPNTPAPNNGNRASPGKTASCAELRDIAQNPYADARQTGTGRDGSGMSGSGRDVPGRDVAGRQRRPPVTPSIPASSSSGRRRRRR